MNIVFRSNGTASYSFSEIGGYDETDNERQEIMAGFREAKGEE